MKPFRTETANFTLYGALFGLGFPVVATFIECLSLFGSVSLADMVRLQSSSELLWIIDSAPFFLGLFARLGGIRQDKVNDILDYSKIEAGRLEVESVVGQGSTFWFSVRLEKQPAGAAPTLVVPASIRGTRVLVVDDNATNRYVLREMLATMECEFGEATDGDTALAELHRGVRAGAPYEIAVLDMEMPGMDGEMLGRRIKRDPQIADTILIVLTSIGRTGQASGSCSPKTTR